MRVVMLWFLVLAASALADARRPVWIDADNSAGVGGVRDVDDAYAILHLLYAPTVDVVGVSSVFGNALIDAAHAATAALVASAGLADPPPVHRGAAGAADVETAAATALADAVERAPAPLTIVALGALTNVAAALALVDPATVAANVVEVVAVAGRRRRPAPETRGTRTFDSRPFGDRRPSPRKHPYPKRERRGRSP